MKRLRVLRERKRWSRSELARRSRLNRVTVSESNPEDTFPTPRNFKSSLTVMAFSGHRTPSMLKRYDIIALDDLRMAAEKSSSYAGTPARVASIGTRREPAE